jgi:hypothetical protein
MRRHYTAFVLLIAIALLAACGYGPEPQQRAAAAPPRCPDPRWQQATSRDSSLVFCLPSDYRRVKQTGLWTRVGGAVDAPPPFVGEDWISVAHVTDAEVHATDIPWPPSLLRDTSWACADCLDATDYGVHWDWVGSRIVRVETARVTGGFAGLRNAPALRSAWPTAEGDWVFVQGQARSMRGLDELRRVLRTVRVSGGNRPAPQPIACTEVGVRRHSGHQKG